MKKGVSPLIATVLIIGFTIALASSIIIWGTGFTKLMQKSAEELSLRSITCTTDVMITIKHACTEGELGVKVLVENYGVKDIESFNIRILGSEGASAGQIPYKLEANGIKLLTTSYNHEEVGTVEKVELIPVISYNGENVVCGNVNEQTTDFSGCTLSDLQMLICQTANDNVPNTCGKLGKIGLVTIEECQSGGFCK